MGALWVTVLMLATGGGYAAATAGMLKMSGGAPSTLAGALIAAGLAVAVAAEVTLLRQATLPVVYLGIVVFETMLVLGFAAIATGTLGVTQVAGAALVLGGFGLVLAEG